MSDNKYQVGGQNRRSINIDDADDLHDWSKALHVSPDELKRAVAQVGDNADTVRDHLKQAQGAAARRQP